jgi:hypothetical protein
LRPRGAKIYGHEIGVTSPHSILLKNPSDQKEAVKKTMSDVSLDHSNRVQTKLARKNARHFSCISAYLQKQGVFQQNRMWRRDPISAYFMAPLLWHRPGH